MRSFQQNPSTFHVLTGSVIGKERSTLVSLTFNPGSIMLNEPMEKSFVSTEEWTETELLNSQLDFPIGKYWIVWLDVQEKSTGLHRTYLLLRPDSLAWEWLSRPHPSGVAGKLNLKESVWIRNLGAISVIT